MNERFKQLASQAGFDVKRLMEPYPGGFPRDDLLALESFAELIVRECAGIACEHMELNEGTDYNIGNKIKEHFGVEE